MLNAWSFVTDLLRLLAGELRFRSRWTPLALGLLGPLFVAVIGNLELARRIGAGLEGYPPVDRPAASASAVSATSSAGAWRAVFDPRPLPTDAFWAPSRIIEGTINEFPYFTFLFADLHPHLMGLPFAVAALIVALGILQARRWPAAAPPPPEPSTLRFWQPHAVARLAGPHPPAPHRRARRPHRASPRFVTGVLYPLNTWDFPTYVIAIAAAFAILELLDRLAPCPTPTRPTREDGQPARRGDTGLPAALALLLRRAAPDRDLDGGHRRPRPAPLLALLRRTTRCRTAGSTPGWSRRPGPTST